jgi:Phosphodiester glycosidase
MLSYKPFSFIYTFLILALPGTLLLTYLFGSPLVGHATASSLQGPHFSLISSTRVADGVTLSREVLQTVAGPELVNRLDLDLTRPSIHLGEVLAHNRLISSDETVRSMANRTKAVAGINGDFFEIGGRGRPIGMVEINGQLLQSPTFYAVMGVTASGGLTFGHEFFSGSVTAGRTSYSLKAINHFDEINEGKLVLLTPALGARVALHGPTVALLQPVMGASHLFRVQSILRNVTSLPALSGQVALAGKGSAGHWLASMLHSGNQVSVTGQPSPAAHLLQAIGGGPILIKDGALYNDPHPPVPGEARVRYPLTAVSLSKDGRHAALVVFDGRRADPVKSVGLTHAEAARYLLAHGAYQAMLFDSGGSSDLVARLPGQHGASVINWPSDGHEVPVANGLFVYSTSP